MAAVPNLVGRVVRTTYGSGPYRVIEQSVQAWRMCPCCWREMATPGHWSFVCVEADTPVRARYRDSEMYWLNGYVWDGAAWVCYVPVCPAQSLSAGPLVRRDTLIVEGLVAAGQQLAMELTA